MKWFLGILFSCALVSAVNSQNSPVYSQDSPYRKELKRADLTGTNMEAITSINEVKPGETTKQHIHHGEEIFYVLEGSTIEVPDGRQVTVQTGGTGIVARDVPHGAYKVVGDKPLKILTVHIVDKGKPLYDAPAK